MESGKVKWKTMDIEDLIQRKVTGEMEQLHPIKGMLEIEMDHSLEVNLTEQDLIDIDVSQEEMEIEMETDPDPDHQGTKVSWKRKWRNRKEIESCVGITK